AAQEPYNPVAAASFNIVTDSTAEAFAVPPTMPSTTYSGLDPAFIDPAPRIFMLARALGSPEELETITPATFPCKRFVTLVEVTSLRFSPEITATALDRCDICLVE